jgi:hypothetical protein
MSFVAGPLFTVSPALGPVEDEGEMSKVVRGLETALASVDHAQAKFYRTDPWVALCLNFLQMQVWEWKANINPDQFDNELGYVRTCWEVMTRRVSDFAAQYNKAPEKNKPVNKLDDAGKKLMEGVRLGDDILDDQLAVAGREGGISSDKLIEFARTQFGVYLLTDEALSKLSDLPVTKHYREVRDAILLLFKKEEIEAGELVLRVIELKHTYTLFKQAVKRLAPPSAAPSPISPVKPTPKSKVDSSSSKKKKEESDDDEVMEVDEEEAKPKKKKKAEKKRTASEVEEEEEEEEEEKPKAKKPKAVPIPIPDPAPANGVPAPLPVATLEDAAKLLAESGVEWMVSKTQQLLRKDARPMVELMGALQEVLRPVALQAIANKDNKVFVEKLRELTAAVKKC